MEGKTNERIQLEVEDLVADDKNKKTLVCPRCPSVILTARMADYREIEHMLPVMTLRKDRRNDEIDMENMKQYWEIADKFSFENIGFSNTVSGMKYLTCADCEIGPLGWFDAVSQKSYVSVKRVKYKD